MYNTERSQRDTLTDKSCDYAQSTRLLQNIQPCESCSRSDQWYRMQGIESDLRTIKVIGTRTFILLLEIKDPTQS